MVLCEIIKLPRLLWHAAAMFDEFPLMVLPVTVKFPEKLAMPPPRSNAALSLTVQLVMVRFSLLRIAAQL